MVREFKQQKYWALILGGSSGLGLATAKKLAKHGMNICIVHRNSRSQEESINTEFQEIISENVAFKSYNLDAFKSEKRDLVISELKELIREGSIRTLVHSVAKGNLKPMVDQDEPTLKHDDFELTINAMAISLYDWTKKFLNRISFPKMLESSVLLVREILKRGVITLLFLPQRLP